MPIICILYAHIQLYLSKTKMVTKCCAPSATLMRCVPATFSYEVRCVPTTCVLAPKRGRRKTPERKSNIWDKRLGCFTWLFRLCAWEKINSHLCDFSRLTCVFGANLKARDGEEEKESERHLSRIPTAFHFRQGRVYQRARSSSVNVKLASN